MRNVPPEAIRAIENGDAGNRGYQSLAKHVVKDLIYPAVSRFIDVIRNVYGHYWVRDLERWDSRRCLLECYCRGRLGLRCSLDGGQTWADFDPDEPGTVRYTFVARPSANFHEYLTQDDWIRIGYRTSGTIPAFSTRIDPYRRKP